VSVEADRPLVLLDVDGVLNAVPGFGRSDVWADWQTGAATAGGRRYLITWSPTVLEAVRSWRELADMQWLTTWGHDANASLRHLLGLPELPVAGTWEDEVAPGAPSPEGGSHADVTPAAPDPLTGRWWKLDVVRRTAAAAPRRRLVWLDDDLRGRSVVRDWMTAHTSSLLVAPDPSSGLVRADLDAVTAFLRA
jgi:hypothetical protein